MYVIEFSCGTVLLVLSSLPTCSLDNGEARWVRVHHLRASNQLKVSSGQSYAVYHIPCIRWNRKILWLSEFTKRRKTILQTLIHILNSLLSKASYYIDGGDRGTVQTMQHLLRKTFMVIN